ncbi:putative sinapoylglucose--sinapoylglucose O-sinapoyltransferase [Helianthus annuus]|nr:putative sinapoylglucose--sinapoylglucose O-sinapoyltransferase [Helianthus annuus]KAJ0665673.1 putative sinapoylglucose--sinapoylglucose O-sinapoyltransferase [Helianthus annuus]KAJ0851435.1 putative sinapoylglucose--sinapoylglucose O-sinapoyltransferase [Helianthus annuus]
METSYKTLLSLFVMFMHLTSLSNSKSIIKNLPGFHGDLTFTLETGYVGIGEDDAVQVFYYFIESQRDPLHDPLLLYIPGGPGASGLYPLLYQIGPLIINFESSTWTNITLELNQNSWAKVANIIFVDLPAGVGFSYAKTWEASRSGDSILALQCYEFIQKWLVEHPRFLNNPFYMSGISYYGLIIPAVTLEIYKGNQLGNQPQVNIKGCICESPLTDKFNDFNSRLEFAHRSALISDDIYESTKETCNGNYINSDPDNTACLYNLQRIEECTSGLNIGNILDPVCDAANPKPNCFEAADKYLGSWANNNVVQKALHVRKGTIETWYKSNYSLQYDMNKEDTIYYSYDIFSSVDYHRQLVARNSHVLIINGDQDMNFPYIGTLKWIKSLDLPTESPWKPWFVSNQVAGYRVTYAKNGYKLTYATIKGAGHVLALDKPEEAFLMVDDWLSTSYLSDI